MYDELFTAPTEASLAKQIALDKLGKTGTGQFISLIFYINLLLIHFFNRY